MSNSQKLIEWLYKEVEGYSRPEKHYEPIQPIFLFYIGVSFSLEEKLWPT